MRRVELDASVIVDAETSADASADTGTVVDAGTDLDAGTVADAGIVSDLDAGTVADAGTVSDDCRSELIDTVVYKNPDVLIDDTDRVHLLYTKHTAVDRTSMRHTYGAAGAFESEFVGTGSLVSSRIDSGGSLRAIVQDQIRTETEPYVQYRCYYDVYDGTRWTRRDFDLRLCGGVYEDAAGGHHYGSLEPYPITDDGWTGDLWLVHYRRSREGDAFLPEGFYRDSHWNISDLRGIEAFQVSPSGGLFTAHSAYTGEWISPGDFSRTSDAGIAYRHDPEDSVRHVPVPNGVEIRIAVDSTRTIHAVYEEAFHSGVPSERRSRLHHLEIPMDGPATRTTLLRDDERGFFRYGTAVTIDSAGGVHVVYNSREAIAHWEHAYRPAGSSRFLTRTVALGTSRPYTASTLRIERDLHLATINYDGLLTYTVCRLPGL